MGYIREAYSQWTFADKIQGKDMLPQPAALPTLPLFQENIETNLEPCPCKRIQSNLRSNSIAFLEMGVGVDCEGRLCKLINFGKKAYNIVKEKVKDVVDDVSRRYD